jgi:hypothetical protein
MQPTTSNIFHTSLAFFHILSPQEEQGLRCGGSPKEGMHESRSEQPTR